MSESGSSKTPGNVEENHHETPKSTAAVIRNCLIGAGLLTASIVTAINTTSDDTLERVGVLLSGLAGVVVLGRQMPDEK